MKKFESNQEFFDATWHWLVVENHPKCADPKTGRCHYRDHQNGTTCVIGAFIPEELYHDDMLTGFKWLVDMDPKLQAWFEHVDRHLLVEVQKVHDENELDRQEVMGKIAKWFKLTVPV